MTTAALLTCGIFVFTMVCLITQCLDPLILGALIPCVLAAFKIIPAGSAFMQFANTTVVFFLGLTVVGEALFKSGLADYIGGKIIGLLGKNEKGLIVGTGIVAGGLSAFLNDTGSCACLMPIVGAMADKAGVSKSKLLMALAYFCSLGGTITLIGTTPHIVTNGILASMKLREFTFFEYAYIGIPLLIIGTLYMILAGTKLLPDKDIKIKGEGRTAEHNPKKMALVGGIFALVVIGMATNIIAPQICGVLGALAIVLTGCLTVKEAVNSFSTVTVFLVGGIFPLSTALVKTGAAEYFVTLLKPVLSGLPPVALIAGITLLMLILTQFLLNSSATVLVLPIAIMTCQAAGINPLAGAMAVSVAASGVFTTPFGTGPNLLVWDAGGYTMKDYMKCGIPLMIIFWIVTTVICTALYL